MSAGTTAPPAGALTAPGYAPAATARPDARMRLPREPYPGLRPFLDFEAALLFGRERQVREIIERLAATQFVAVLGGSGSGKSSLIHAGVTPELRSFGIAHAGDLWLPMTCTPGTNVSRADSTARIHTPITRLARRFAGLLRTRGSEEADAQRQAQIAEAFRQEAGFARLVDAYAEEFDIPPGLDPREARVLFVIDQFEEVFHPTNQGVDDATRLVERVLDHFFLPHSRCYVVITMRSEHLNDCAAFLELPDAINKSSFLVRRLDPDELREAIVGPAQRFLRLMARSEGHARPLPAQVQFEPAVIDRLLRDVTAITHDPDHLPLLQHLLARLWQSALEREEMDVPVPAFITEIDLVRAVNARAPGDEQPLDPRLNTLRECVDSWPEQLYLLHDDAQRRQLDELFRRLAFKDPNTGLYSQQRIQVDEGARLLGPGRTRLDLRALVSEGFLGSVDYLYWDDEDPARVTLKVSHESFIRGWKRFRALIDAESERFDQYAGIARKCADWAEHQRDDDYLLEAGELRRLRDGDFERRLADADQRAVWERFLGADRDGARLTRSAGEIAGFIAASQRRLRERERREQLARRSGYWLAVGTTILGLIPTALFAVLIQGPTMRRVEMVYDASNMANAVPPLQVRRSAGASEAALDTLLRAAARLDMARTGEGLGITRLSPWLIDSLQGVDIVRRQTDLLRWVIPQAEPLINGRLRQTLQGDIWRSSAPQGPPLPAPQSLDTPCAPAPGAPPTPENMLAGRLYVAPNADMAAGSPLRRAVLVPQGTAGAGGLTLYSAGFDPRTGRCVFGAPVLTTSAALGSRAVFDADLRHFAFTAEGAGAGSGGAALIVQEVEWGWDEAQGVIGLHHQTVGVLGDPSAAAAVRAAAGPERAAPIPTWLVPGGRTFAAGAQHLRIVTGEAQPLPADEGAGPGQWRALQTAPASSVCGALALGLARPSTASSTMYETDAACVRIEREAADAGAPDEAVHVALYARPNGRDVPRLAESPPVPVAVLRPFVRVAQGAALGERLRIGVSGPYAGWLMLEREAGVAGAGPSLHAAARAAGRTAERGADGGVARGRRSITEGGTGGSAGGSAGGSMAAGADQRVGLPLSTCALWRLGREMRPYESTDSVVEGPRASVCVNR